MQMVLDTRYILHGLEIKTHNYDSNTWEEYKLKDFGLDECQLNSKFGILKKNYGCETISSFRVTCSW